MNTMYDTVADVLKAAMCTDWSGGLGQTDRGEGQRSTARVPIAGLKVTEMIRGSGVDAAHVRILAEVSKSLPPILVHHETMRVLDGVHRLAAARLNGDTEIEVLYFRGSDADAFRVSVMANVAHGLPLGLSDRRAAAARILATHQHLSDRAIARSAGLSPGTVAGLRAKTATQGDDRDDEPRLGSDGRVRPLTTVRGRLMARDVIERQPDATLREIAGAAGVSIGTARDVRNRLSAGMDPVPPSLRSKPGAVRTPRYPARPSADLATALGRLRRDPALRYSDSGRAILRWLDQRAVTVEQGIQMIQDLPPHCGDAVADVARANAEAWSALVERLARR